MICAKQQNFFKNLSFKVSMIWTFSGEGAGKILQKEQASSNLWGVRVEGGDREEMFGGESVGVRGHYLEVAPGKGPESCLSAVTFSGLSGAELPGGQTS